MTSRERLSRALLCQPVDRVPVHLWGVNHLVDHAEASYQCLVEMMRKYRSDVIVDWWPAIDDGGDLQARFETRPSRHEGFEEDVTTIQTPQGPLVSSWLRSLEGKPGYHGKYLLETPEDAEKWLSIPWAPPKVDCSGWQRCVQETGVNGLVRVGIGEAMYTVNDLTGSETWAYWLLEERELLHRMVQRAQERQMYIVKELLAGGVSGLFGYVGPELCIPPLASPRDFDEYVVQYDKPMHDLIHEAGGQVWVHCHGKMGPVVKRFADAGVDCLNPIEPPPMGDITIGEAREIIGDRMCFDGGLEIGDLATHSAEEIERMTQEVIWQSGGIGLILTFSSSPYWRTLPPQVLRNYEVFFETAMREGKKVCE